MATFLGEITEQSSTHFVNIGEFSPVWMLCEPKSTNTTVVVGCYCPHLRSQGGALLRDGALLEYMWLCWMKCVTVEMGFKVSYIHKPCLQVKM